MNSKTKSFHDINRVNSPTPYMDISRYIFFTQKIREVTYFSGGSHIQVFYPSWCSIIYFFLKTWSTPMTDTKIKMLSKIFLGQSGFILSLWWILDTGAFSIVVNANGYSSRDRAFKPQIKPITWFYIALVHDLQISSQCRLAASPGT